MMRLMADYLRTCKTCKHEWIVGGHLAKTPPGRMSIASAKMEASGARMMTLGLGGGGASQQVRNLEERRNRIIDAKSCPSCGSTTHKQVRATKKVRKAYQARMAANSLENQVDSTRSDGRQLGLASELEKLEQLQRSGTLSKKEYKSAKAKLLGT